MLTSDTVGPVLITLVSAEDEEVPLWKSVPVTVQRIVSPAATLLLVSCNVLFVLLYVVPVVSLVHAKVLVTGVNPSGSVAVPVHVNESDVVADGDGVTETPLTTGLRLSTETD